MKTLDKNQLEAIQAMTDHVISECSVVDTERMYDEMLDECYSFDKVGGIFSCMCPSRVLRECDPVAYRCGKNDWLDGERDNLVEIGDGHFQAEEVEKEKKEFIDQLRDELSGFESDLGDAKDDKDGHGEEIAERDIALKQAQIDACENHSF